MWKLAVILLWREIFITTGKKKRYSRLSGGCAIIITTGNKRYSRLSVGCAVLAITTGKKKQSSAWQVVLLYCVSFWFWREIGSFFVVAGNFYYNRKKKIQSLAGVGSIMTGKKTGNWQFFCCGGKVLLQPEKKDTVVCLAGAQSITTGKKKIQSSVCWVHILNIKFELVQLELKLIHIR